MKKEKFTYPIDPDNKTHTFKNDKFTYTTNADNGTVVSEGYEELTKSNHKGMPPRTDAYSRTCERGHTNASSTGGGNHTLNVHPMEKDLNHGGYYTMEKAEREALKSGASIYSVKTAYNSGPAGTAPEAYMVSDTITYADGSTQKVHLSFANLSNDEQEAFNQLVDENAYELDEPIPGDIGREQYSPEEYAQLMEECEPYLDGIEEEYSQDYAEFSYDDVSVTDDGVDLDEE